MIVKIYGESGRWTIFDNVKYVDYDTNITEVHSDEEFDTAVDNVVKQYSDTPLFELAEIIRIIPHRPFNPEYEAGKYWFCHLLMHVVYSTPIIVIFDTKVFLCNDDGKTIERIGVVGQ